MDHVVVMIGRLIRNGDHISTAIDEDLESVFVQHKVGSYIPVPIHHDCSGWIGTREVAGPLNEVPAQAR